MARPIQPADDATVAAARLALERLREARNLLELAGAPRAADRVRLAITSAGGAVRHAESRRGRTLRGEIAAA